MGGAKNKNWTLIPQHRGKGKELKIRKKKIIMEGQRRVYQIMSYWCTQKEEKINETKAIVKDNREQSFLQLKNELPCSRKMS